MHVAWVLWPLSTESDGVRRFFGIGASADGERFGKEFVGAFLVGFHEGADKRRLLIKDKEFALAFLGELKSSGLFEFGDELLWLSFFAITEVDGEGAVDGIHLEGVALLFALFYADDLATETVVGVGADHVLGLLRLSAGDHLEHHGILGQKWGVRHYQNTDGSYKSGAQGRYNNDGSPGVNKSISTSGGKSSGGRKSSNVKTGSKKDAKGSKSKGPRKKMSTKKKVAIGAAVVGASALAAYGVHKYNRNLRDQYNTILQEKHGIWGAKSIDVGKTTKMKDVKETLKYEGGTTKVRDVAKDELRKIKRRIV